LIKKLNLINLKLREKKKTNKIKNTTDNLRVWTKKKEIERSENLKMICSLEKELSTSCNQFLEINSPRSKY